MVFVLHSLSDCVIIRTRGMNVNLVASSVSSLGNRNEEFHTPIPMG